MSALSQSAVEATTARRTSTRRELSAPLLTPSDGNPLAQRRRASASATASSKSTARHLDDADSMTDAGSEEDFGNTSEVAAAGFDEEMLESTAARPQHPSEVSTAVALGSTRPRQSPPAGSPEESQEAILVDDLAEIEVLEEEAPPTERRGRRRTLEAEKAEAPPVVDTAAAPSNVTSRAPWSADDSHAEPSISRGRAEDEGVVPPGVTEGGTGEDRNAEVARAFGEHLRGEHAVHAGIAVRELAEHDPRDPREVAAQAERREHAIEPIGALGHVLEGQDRAVREEDSTGRQRPSPRRVRGFRRRAALPPCPRGRLKDCSIGPERTDARGLGANNHESKDPRRPNR